MIALTGPSVPLAFLAGLASFLSPCVFPLVPVYAAYLGGRAAAETCCVSPRARHAEICRRRRG